MIDLIFLKFFFVEICIKKLIKIISDFYFLDLHRKTNKFMDFFSILGEDFQRSIFYDQEAVYSYGRSMLE